LLWIFAHQQWTLELINKILYNFNKTAGLFSQPIYSKLFAIVLLALSCLGTKGVKNEKITWKKISIGFSIGFVLFFLNAILLQLPTALLLYFIFYLPVPDTSS
jgi:hypothetical protein